MTKRKLCTLTIPMPTCSASIFGKTCLAVLGTTKSGTRSKLRSDLRAIHCGISNYGSARHPCRQQTFRRTGGATYAISRNRFGGISYIAWRKWLGQTHVAAAGRGVRTAHRRRNLDAGRTPGQPTTVQTPREHSVPTLRAVSPLERKRKRRLRVASCRSGETRKFFA